MHRVGFICKWLYKDVPSKKHKILQGMFMGRDEILINDDVTYFLETNVLLFFFKVLLFCVPSCHFCSELKRDLICHCSCLLDLRTPMLSVHGSYNAATLNHFSQSVWPMRDGYGREIAFHLFRPPVWRKSTAQNLCLTIWCLTTTIVVVPHR